VPGAATYRIAIATDDAMEHIIQRATTADTSYVLKEATAGARYFAEVRAVGSEEIVGEWSTPRALRVVHYTLPNGALVARDGTVVMAPDTTLTLSNMDGVEAAFEDVRNLGNRIPGVPLYWQKVTGPFRLPADTGMRLVHLRDATLGTQTVLNLAHREIRADIDLTPRNPTPGSFVDARVVVYDPSGRIDPANEPVTIQAQRNHDTIPVEWRQMGSTWSGRVPVGGAGIAVLRIVAKDSHGVELGAGFLELGGP
jgi:hypothetical protein